MNERKKISAWLPDLTDQVDRALQELGKHQQDCTPALSHERAQLDARIEGWQQSLGNRELDRGVRAAVEANWAADLKRVEEIDELLAAANRQNKKAGDVVKPAQVLERLDRLAEVLASNNPSRGNLELSLHIDRIDCYSDGKILLRTCKLGTMVEAAELLSTPCDSPETDEEISVNSAKAAPKPRRRTRLRAEDDSQTDLRPLMDFASDPDRFVGLGEEWFWRDKFQVPDPEAHWYVANAEAVFKRRQEKKLSHEKLAMEFDVSKPTIKAAIRHYITTHPDAKDEVNLPRGGARSRTVNVEPHADEVRRLWDAGAAEFALAKQFGWPTTAVERAVRISYAKDGLPVPTSAERRQAKIAHARRLLDEQLQRGDPSLEKIARALGISDVTARAYLCDSFAAEDKPMPDLRRRRE